MKLIKLSLIAFFSIALVGNAVADENHEIIEKAMKEGFKGPKDGKSQIEKLMEGELNKEDAKELVDLIKTMKGTKAPVGDQSAYDEKVKEMIEAIEAVAGGDTSVKAVERLDTAQSCKPCHSKHKPKK